MVRIAALYTFNIFAIVYLGNISLQHLPVEFCFKERRGKLIGGFYRFEIRDVLETTNVFLSNLNL